ncbi:MAG: molybdopterin-dependent oxidoreductase [Actinomycetota bacterium]|nr:molybdopterin-dependent oxidoreductase [Actinomycetota bacterium]
MSRWSNLALLWLVPLAALTGFVAFVVGDAGALPAALVHGASALAVVALVPWKSTVVRRGLARARPGRSGSVVLGVVVLLALATGILHVLGVLASDQPVTVLQVHVGAGVVAAAMTLAHARDRRVRARRSDLSRRTLMRAGILALAGTSAAGAVTVAGAALASAGTRRVTGSFSLTSGDVDAIPATSWLLDTPPGLDHSSWRLTVAARDAVRSWSLDGLGSDGLLDDRVSAVLDCTGGWWTRQTWVGARLSHLLPPGTTGTVLVTSATGYSRRLPLTDDLLLATSLGGEPLRAGHGAPARLVVPGRRGHHWVKWVVRIEVVTGPWWLEPPLPLR